MKDELVPLFVKTPAWQVIKSKQKPTNIAKGLTAVSSHASTGESSPGRLIPSLGAISSLQRQSSVDSDAQASARQSAVEDVAAGESLGIKLGPLPCILYALVYVGSCSTASYLWQFWTSTSMSIQRSSLSGC